VKAISLLSGGLDSVVATWAAQRDHEVAAALTCDYGQRAAAREIAAAGQVAAKLGCPHIVVHLPWLGQLGRNALTDPTLAVPEPGADALDDRDVTERTASAVWVPNRNGVMLNVAAAYAEALDCQVIICGFNAEEAATFPDNTPEYMAALDACFAFSTSTGVRVISPTAHLTKPQIVALSKRIGAPLEDVWSCYHGGPEPCNKCESCRRLARAKKGT
jgi:7-cyano-7-deazaguanine synthase